MKIVADGLPPDLPNEELERERKRTLEGAAIEVQRPERYRDARGADAHLRPRAPVRPPTSGLPGSVATIGREDLVASTPPAGALRAPP